MKKLTLLTLVLFLSAATALAEPAIITTPFDRLEVTFNLPSGAKLTQSIKDNLVILDISSAQQAGADFHLIITHCDVQGFSDLSMADMPDAAIQEFATFSSGDMPAFSYEIKQLPNGMKAVLLNEQGDSDQYTSMYTLIHGYLVSVRADQHGTGHAMTEKDYQDTIDLFSRLDIKPKK